MSLVHSVFNEECSGQKTNKEKSTILFSKNTGDACRNTIKHALQVSSETLNEKYLGLPVYVVRLKKRGVPIFKGQDLEAYTRVGKEKLLSKAGKEVLIKAVAQAIPTYAMSCLDLTKSLCHEISTMIC